MYPGIVARYWVSPLYHHRVEHRVSTVAEKEMRSVCEAIACGPVAISTTYTLADLRDG